MKKGAAKWLYVIYAVLIIGPAVYFAYMLTQGRYEDLAVKVNRFFTGGFVGESEEDSETSITTISESGTCPCKSIGKSMPGCSHDFFFNTHGENSILLYELIPGYEGLFDGMEVCIPPSTIKINSVGFRDHDYSIEKPEGVFRIVVLGDSLTMGLGVEMHESYPKVLERMLKSGPREFEVLNLGIVGYNLIHKIEVLRRKGVSYKPDLILFQYSADDVVDKNIEKEFERKALNAFALEKGISADDIIEKDRRDIHRQVLDGIFIKVREDPSEFSELMESRFDQLKRIVEAEDIRVLIFTIQSRQMDNVILKRVAGSHGWGYLELDSIYNEFDKSKLYVYYPNDPHPSSMAHEIIARRIFEKLFEDLQDRPVESGIDS